MDETELQHLARAVAAELSRELVEGLTAALAASSARLQERVTLALLEATALPAQRLPAAGSAVFRREGQFWTLSYDGEVTRLRDCRGFRHLARLLARPNQPVHVLELVHSGDPGAGLRPDGGLPVLDARAKAAYRRRLAELDEELQDAADRGDAARVERAALERDFLVDELSRALGLGGRDRTTGGTSERARVAVTKAIRSAMGTVHEHHRALGSHLERTVRTGLCCSYTCDPSPAWVC